VTAILSPVAKAAGLFSFQVSGSVFFLASRHNPLLAINCPSSRGVGKLNKAN